MEILAVNGQKTKEIETRRISLARVESTGSEQRGQVVGWEYGPPRAGERYVVHLGKGRVLRTSHVQEVRGSGRVLLLKTVNSLYRVEYQE